MANSSLIPLALELTAAGYSCIPIEMPTKAPAWRVLPKEFDVKLGRDKSVWKPFQTRVPTPEECHRFWANGASIAMVAGVNHVELIDFDIPEKNDEGFTRGEAPAWKPFVALMKENGHEDLLKRLGCQNTPSGGFGIIYRCPDVEIPGNMKLACRKDNKTLIETRGQGGYFGIAPTPGYKLYGLKVTDIPIITEEERAFLLTAAGLLDERESIDQADKSHRYERVVSAVSGRPGDWYNSNGPHLVELLQAYGWVESGRSGNRIAMTRPGKKRGHGLSGTVTMDGECFWCFSTSTEFEAEYAYSKFSAYTRLEHHGDFHAAATAIRRDMMPMSDPKRQMVTEIKSQAVVMEARRNTGWAKASEIAVEHVDWLLEPYIPLGEVTLLVGDPGVGKSTVAQAIATAVSLGGNIGARKLEKGEVIFMSAEQSRSKITVPRFKQMGADLGLITLPDEDDPTGEVDPFILDSAGTVILREVAEQTGAKLIVIDTMTAYIEATRDINTANQVREWMRRLIAIARGTNCAMLVLMHPNKSQSTNPLHKIMGSIDFSGAVRSVLYAGKDPDDEEVRSVAHVKSNVGPMGDPLGYAIDSESGFYWLNDSTLTMDRILEQPQVRSARGKRDACEEWLKDYLKDQMVPSKMVFENGKREGFGRDMIYELKSKLRIRMVRSGFQSDVQWTLIPETGEERWDQK